MISKLIEISSSGLSESRPALPADPCVAKSRLVQELYKVLDMKNGFYAFESALHVFPSGIVKEGYSIEEWNDPDKWIKGYKHLMEDLWFFAEDIFGEQFAINLNEENICRFNPETAGCEKIAGNFEEWAKVILDDYNVETGYPLAHEWQALYGPLAAGHRLVPKTLFILGGKFDIDNLVSRDAVKGMSWRADIVLQIHHLPDGSKIRFKVVE